MSSPQVHRAFTAPRAAAVLLVLVAIAVWTDLGAYHRHHHGDTIVPVLTSLYRWTFFYWEDDRFGMVIPMLALPVSHPFWNLMLQCAIAIFAGLSSFFVVARCVGRDTWVPLGAVGALLYLGGHGAEGGGLFVTGQTYGVSLALAGAGLVLLLPRDGGSPWRFVVGTAVTFAALWSATTVAFVLGPILLGRWLFELDGTTRRTATTEVAARIASRQERRRAQRENRPVEEEKPPSRASQFARFATDFLLSPTGVRLAIVAVAFVASYVASRTSPYYIPGRYSPLPVGEWLENWAGIGRNAWNEQPLTLKVGAPTIALLGLAVGLGRRDGTALRTAGAAFACLASGGLLSFLLTGIVTWTKLEDRAGRYAVPAVFMLELALLALGLIPILAALSERGRRVFAWVSLVALLGVGLVKAGPPSLRGVREDLDRTLGMRTTEIIDSGATHIVGNYWKVWPSVYHANLTLHEMGSNRRVWGITQRASPTADLWARMPVSEMRLCAAVDDEEVGKWLGIYRFPKMMVDKKLQTIMLIRQSPEAPKPAQQPRIRKDPSPP